MVEIFQVIKYFDIWVDKNLSVKHQIFVACQKAMANIVRIRNIWNTLTVDACNVLMLAPVLSNLGYCNVISYWLPEVDLKTYNMFRI